MDPTTQALLSALLGAVLGAGVILAWRVSEREQQWVPPSEEPLVPPGVATVLSVLRSSALVVDEDDRVLQASAPAYALGLVRGTRLEVEDLADLVRQVRRDGQIREAELVLGRSDLDRQVSARVAPLGSRLVLALVEDRTHERRVEAIRRDFVANVSHELKTPVGAINLLAEAVAEASDDPEAVERFAGRMRMESDRLAHLVQQIIALSRLQGHDPLISPHPVPLAEVVAHAIDKSSIDAETRNIEVVDDGNLDVELQGNRDQITMAISNLVANAVAYSPEHSRVVVSVKVNETTVDVTVSDQGIGIPAEEIDRIFERFYRVDPARHRSTGGTGLGLSIVKHVAATHGGEVRVWSEEGQGSSFTLSLPHRTTAEAARPASEPVESTAATEATRPTPKPAESTEATRPTPKPAESAEADAAGDPADGPTLGWIGHPTVTSAESSTEEEVRR